MIELYIIPSENLETDDDEEEEEASNEIPSLNFTWNIIEMEDDILSF